VRVSGHASLPISAVTLVLIVAAVACGSDPGAGVDGSVGGDATPGLDAGPLCCDDDTLSTAVGCAGVFNPDQVLDLHLTMTAGDWSALRADTTNSVMFPAEFSCNDDPPIGFSVGVRRKRSGGIDKPGLKVDFNFYQAGGEFQSLKKLSLENGISEGSGTAERKDMVGEYLAWRVMVLSGAISGRAAFARVFVNGALVGTYVDVEQVDKRFLRSRLGDDSGWLYKKSGSAGDGYKTNETVANPYEDDLCFWDSNPCPSPSAEELATYLPEHLDIDQMLRFGGMNALTANSDAPLVKDNNYYFYDRAGAPRLYLPWDLDTTMKDMPAMFGGAGTMLYTDILFTHWEDDYDALLTGLLEGPLTLATIHAELERAGSVAGAALDADPAIGGSASDAVVTDLKGWWATRHAQVQAELQAH
jgi:hypothetical protein